MPSDMSIPRLICRGSLAHVSINVSTNSCQALLEIFSSFSPDNSDSDDLPPKLQSLKNNMNSKKQYDHARSGTAPENILSDDWRLVDLQFMVNQLTLHISQDQAISALSNHSIGSFYSDQSEQPSSSSKSNSVELVLLSADDLLLSFIQRTHDSVLTCSLGALQVQDCLMQPRLLLVDVKCSEDSKRVDHEVSTIPFSTPTPSGAFLLKYSSFVATHADGQKYEAASLSVTCSEIHIIWNMKTLCTLKDAFSVAPDIFREERYSNKNREKVGQKKAVFRSDQHISLDWSNFDKLIHRIKRINWPTDYRQLPGATTLDVQVKLERCQMSFFDAVRRRTILKAQLTETIINYEINSSQSQLLVDITDIGVSLLSPSQSKMCEVLHKQKNTNDVLVHVRFETMKSMSDSNNEYMDSAVTNFFLDVQLCSVFAVVLHEPINCARSYFERGLFVKDESNSHSDRLIVQPRQSEQINSVDAKIQNSPSLFGFQLIFSNPVILVPLGDEAENNLQKETVSTGNSPSKLNNPLFFLIDLGVIEMNQVPRVSVEYYDVGLVPHSRPQLLPQSQHQHAVFEPWLPHDGDYCTSKRHSRVPMTALNFEARKASLHIVEFDADSGSVSQRESMRTLIRNLEMTVRMESIMNIPVQIVATSLDGSTNRFLALGTCMNFKSSATSINVNSIILSLDDEKFVSLLHCFDRSVKPLFTNSVESNIPEHVNFKSEFLKEENVSEEKISPCFSCDEMVLGQMDTKIQVLIRSCAVHLSTRESEQKMGDLFHISASGLKFTKNSCVDESYTVCYHSV